MSKNGKSNKNKRSKSNKMKSRSNGNEYLQKSNGNTNGDLRSLSNAELQAEILAAETEHPKIQKLIELAESKGKISID
ncbi:MAG TPA: hypothetical protein DCL76_08525, partial [Chloroflexi bacterium]|nr:hypothetical protein [Chloroflexota bacterium]